MKKSKLLIYILIPIFIGLGFAIPPKAQTWVIDPELCTGCGQCAESCVRPVSAVKASIDYSKLEKSEFNPAMFKKTKPGSSEGRENQICPTAAIKRTKINDSTWNYSIDTSLCIGCGSCAIRSKSLGDSSFTTQITQSCDGCNECNISIVCPVQAISRGGKK